MDRDKALDIALANIEKQFGKGSLMRLGDEAAVKVPAIPSGALALDVALGIGGLPRGRVVEIYGPESSGKCLTADTYVWTDHGLETIAELFARVDQPTSGTARVTDVSAYGVRLVNEEGRLEAMAGVTHNGRRPVTRVILDSGRHVDATANHPLRVIDEDGYVVWREVGDLCEGDVLVSALFGAETSTGGSDLTEDEALLLGYLVAGGPAGASTRHRPAVGAAGVQSRDGSRNVDEAVLALTEHVFGISRARARAYGGRNQLVHDPAIRRLLADEYGLAATATATWDVPHGVRTGGPKIQRAFLAALFEAAGRVEAGPSVGLATPSRAVAEQVQLLLYGLGIPARLSTGQDDERERDDHGVSVPPVAVQRFVEQIGLRSGRVDAPLPRHDTDAGSDALAPPDPLAGRLSTCERVVSLEDRGDEPTFDVVVPGTHSFLANGVLSHNTTVALHVIAEAQKLGGIAAFIDAEHALDPVYARALGVDINELLVSQPDTGEQALEIADMLVRSAAVDIIVIDSVAALTPRAEIEGEMGDTHVGLQARLMSQALRKLAGSLKRSNTTAVFINQLREKVGVMFGCMSWDTEVTLADGTKEYIGKIVDQRLPVEVLSYDTVTGDFVAKQVVNWFNNGATSDFLHVSVANGGSTGSSRSTFACTPNHLVATPNGWTPAGDLQAGDPVLRPVEHYLSEFQWDVLLGMLMGDGLLSPTRNGLAARLRWRHGDERAAYADWKASLFENLDVSRPIGSQGAGFFDLQPLHELNELRRAVYLGGRKVLSFDYLKRLTALSIALWYQDVGSFSVSSKALQDRTRSGSGRSEICVEAMERTSRERLRQHLADTWDLHARLVSRAGKAVLEFPAAQTVKLHALVAPFVHPSMDDKLLPRFRGQFKLRPEFEAMRTVAAPMPVVDITSRPATSRPDRFDIEVEGSHSYLAGGVVVHNSPETTPGGRALKFYSSVRLDVRRIETLKDGTSAVGNRVRVKVVKNKVAPPFRQAEFDIIYGEGISKEGSLIDVGVEEGIIRKAGAWYTYDGEQLGQGKENARSFLREHVDVAQEIEKRVKEKLGIDPLVADGNVVDEGL